MFLFIKRFKICKKIIFVLCCNENNVCIIRWKLFKLVKIISFKNKLIVFLNFINLYGELLKVKCVLVCV